MHVCVPIDVKIRKEGEEDGQKKKETEEEKKPRTVDGANTGQEEAGDRPQQEEQQPKKGEGDKNPGRAVGSLQGSDPNDADKRKPESHTDKQQRQSQNGMHSVNCFT